MRSIIFAAVLSLALAPSAFAKAPNTFVLDKSHLDSGARLAGPCRDAHGHFMKCAAVAPPGATAKCRDGSLSFSQHHQGTCSHHGGVSAWLH